ncbi:ScbR family autoregulator-binding transcription factor [Lentzea sp. BCCO 10_0856]|uniref:ScbR family autoregulator-binding transcription factor n=1 Tax=Lentzea miocenica TaxID=3095431 RepID=A0ABU4T8V9_9PSEU|nr:ScbR family autoregulator-binding transcription factor [Lentzea sp. BCCO 10_0856]MDX8034601.1 ScbR family autoregulator-binding transcription factor [Lentzea sp. BCCO 10_0856]
MPQQDRAYATREAILHAAAEEFDRLGYERTSLTAVLARAGLTKGAFYFHFASKEAVAAALIEQQSETWAQMRESWRLRGVDPLSALHGMFVESADRMAADVVLRAGVRLNADREIGYPGVPSAHAMWEKLITGYLAEAQQRGDLRSGVDPEAVARTLCGAALGARLISSATTACADFPARIREVLGHVLPCVASAEWKLSGSQNALDGAAGP